MKKPTRLNPGDKVAVVALGSYFDKDLLEKGIRTMEGLGLEAVPMPNLFKRDFIYAGSVKQRVDDLTLALKRKDIKAIWCVRGGAGAYEVAEELARLNPRRFQPKIFIGLSDVTAIHSLFNCKWKWTTLHGPLLTRLGRTDLTSSEMKSLRGSLFEPDYRYEVKSGLKSLGKKAKITGDLVGGNLILLVTSLGTKWEINTEGKILFIEDVGEKAYRIDRDLWHLQAAGKFKKLKGLVFGQFTDCLENNGQEYWKAVIIRKFLKAPFPVLTGVPCGHGDPVFPLPFGVKVELNTVRPCFRVLDGYLKSK